MHELVAFNLHGNCWFASFHAFEPHDMSMAAYVHIFAKSDFRRHHQDHLHRGAFFEGKISPYQRASGAQILSAACAGTAFRGDSQKNRYLIGEALTAAALNPVLFSARHPINLAQKRPPGKLKRSVSAMLHRHRSTPHH